MNFIVKASDRLEHVHLGTLFSPILAFLELQVFKYFLITSFFILFIGSTAKANVIENRYKFLPRFCEYRPFSNKHISVPNNYDRNQRHRLISYYLEDGLAGKEALSYYDKKWSR